MKRFFYNQEGTANKYWFIDLQGSLLHITYGPVGGTGGRQTKYLNTPHEADEEAEKLVKEKLRKGYREVDGAADIPPKSAEAIAAAVPVPPRPKAPTSLRLLPEKLAGKRVQLTASFDKYRLGGKPQVRQLLREAGATVLMPSTKGIPKPADFILGGPRLEGGPHLDDYFYNQLNTPVVFEEELCAPLGPSPTGRLAELRPAVLNVLRRLLTHPNILVRYISYGPPLTGEDIARYEKKLRRPLPALFKAFYQQIGELQVVWQYRWPLRHLPLGSGAKACLDYTGVGDGAIQILPLSEMLSADWFKPARQLGLQPSQRVFDYFSPTQLMAVDLGAEDDPWLHLGTHGGRRFDEHPPIRFSDYLGLVFTTFGALAGRAGRLARATAGLPEPLETYLAALAANEFPNPFGEKLQNQEAIDWLDDLLPVLEAYARVQDETRFFDQLEFSVEHRRFALGSIERNAGPATQRLLALPRAAALRARAAATDPTPGRVTVEKTNPIGYLSDESVLFATVLFTNPSGRDNAVLGYRARLLLRFGYPNDLPAPRPDVLLHEYDSVDHARQLRPIDAQHMEYTRPDGRVASAYGYAHELPFALPARSRQELKLFLHDIDWRARARAAGLTTMPERGYPQVFLQVDFRLAQPGPDQPLQFERSVAAYGLGRGE